MNTGGFRGFKMNGAIGLEELWSCRPVGRVIFKGDKLVKSQKVVFPVIPAKAGIQFFPPVISSLDSGFHRSDDFLRDHQRRRLPEGGSGLP